MSLPATAARMKQIARACHPVAVGEARILGLYLFGSEAEGTAGEHSDVDLGVLFADRSAGLEDVVRLEARFAEALERSVDLVNLGTCNAFLALQAIRGERIYEGDGLACDEFDLYVMRRAADLAPYEHERRRMILESGGSLQGEPPVPGSIERYQSNAWALS